MSSDPKARYLLPVTQPSAVTIPRVTAESSKTATVHSLLLTKSPRSLRCLALSFESPELTRQRRKRCTLPRLSSMRKLHSRGSGSTCACTMRKRSPSSVNRNVRPPAAISTPPLGDHPHRARIILQDDGPVQHR